MLWLDEWTKRKIGQDRGQSPDQGQDQSCGQGQGQSQSPDWGCGQSHNQSQGKYPGQCAGPAGGQREAEAEALSREALEDYQLRKLKETIELAVKCSPFYRERLSNVRLTTLKDMEMLPMMSAEDLRREGQNLYCAGAAEIARIVTLATSGTAGEPKRVAFTEADQELTVDYFHHGMKNLVDQSDRVLILMPVKRAGSVGDLLRRGLERLGAAPVLYGPLDGTASDIDHCLRVICEEGITSLVGLPDQAARLARTAGERALSPAWGPACAKIKENMRTALLSGEYVSAYCRESIAGAWSCRIYEHYGMTEMGLGCAVSCHALEGYHVREADLFLEIVDPVTGRRAGDGESGEIVFTTLTRRGMPLIRYKTGDESRWLTKPCPCGSRLRRLERVKSRVYG